MALSYERKYKLHYIAKRIYVSSTGHYFASVTLMVNNTSLLWLSMDFPDCGYPHTKEGRFYTLPRYIQREIMERFHSMIMAKEFTYYERDMYGNDRETGYRYHDIDRVAYYALWLEKELKK